MDRISGRVPLPLHLLLQVLVWTRIVGVTHWKLQENSIVPASAAPPLSTSEAATAAGEADDLLWSSVSGEDPEFSVLMKRSTGSGGHSHGGGGLGAIAGGAVAQGGRAYGQKSCPQQRRMSLNKAGECVSKSDSSQEKCSDKTTSSSKSPSPRNPNGSGPMSVRAMREAQPMMLSCGEPVEATDYDFLEGIALRHEHPSYPEPEVAMIFKRSEADTSVDLFEVELALRRAYQENPESLTVLNQIGNYWRIKGNTQLAIECFRTALSLSPNHPDLLLNLARVLFNLQFMEDAVYLAKRSLHMKSSETHAWLQYFTLGEVYKALEKYEEAAFYFLKSLELNPSLQVAEVHLRELGLEEQTSVNIYTLFIILGLIGIVLVVLYYLLVAVSGTKAVGSSLSKR